MENIYGEGLTTDFMILENHVICHVQARCPGKLVAVLSPKVGELEAQIYKFKRRWMAQLMQREHLYLLYSGAQGIR